MRIFLLAAVVLAPLFQASLWLPGVGDTGVPVCLLIWLSAGLALLWLQAATGSLRLPAPLPTQVLFLSIAGIALVGLMPEQLVSGLRELVQYGLVLGFAWLIGHQFGDEWVRRVGPAVLGAATLVLAAGGASGILLERPPFDLSHAKYGALMVAGTPFLVLWLRRFDRLVLVVLPTLGVLVGLTFGNAGLILIWALILLVAARNVAPRAAPFALAGAGLALAMSWVPSSGPAPWDAVRPRFDEAHLRRIYVEDRAALLAPRRLPFGAGPGHYKDAINRLKLRLAVRPSPDENRIPRDSNNQYLLALVETGPLGALALVGLLLAAGTAPSRTQAEDGEPSRRFRSTSRTALLGLALAGLFCVILSRGTGVWLGLLLGFCTRGAASTARGFSVRALLPWFVPAGTALAALVVAARVNASAPSSETGISAVNRQAAEVLFGRAELPDRPELRVTDVDPFSEVPVEFAGIGAEAENARQFDEPWTTLRANDASGNRALGIPEKAGKGEGTAVYELRVGDDQAGTYRFRARVRWRDACGNSVGFSVGKQTGTVASQRFEEWHWVEAPRTVDLGAGTHTLTLHNLEDGIAIDHWQLDKLR